MKCDGELASVPLFPAENGQAFFSSGYSTCGLENSFLDSLNNKMVPCKMGSPPQLYSGSSDTNGNNIDTHKMAAGREPTSVNQLTSQVTELQRSLLTLQKETDATINRLKQELADKASIVETLQQQIRMKMFINLAGGKTLGNPVMQALADMQGNVPMGLDPFLGPNEDLMMSWRKNLEHSLLGLHHHQQQQHHQADRVGAVTGGATPKTPGSPNTVRSSDTPFEGGGPATPSQAEAGGVNTAACRTPSDLDRETPRSRESGSPAKDDTDEGVSPTPSPLPPSLPALIPKSFASSVGPPPPPPSLSVPPMFSSRIPKGDPLEERLHDMLRYNMEKFAGQPIDTLADSRRVREMLSVHNIGQRLFAKYVLGLSQGTVSELLSKPKSWDKLTEKGRDSYRKMHAWVWDDQAILLLKTLIPRKGELLRSSSASNKQDIEDRQDERINKILSEVNKCPDNVVAKQLFPHMDHPNLAPGLLLPALPHHPGGHQEDLKLALSLYQAELSQLHRLQRPDIKPDDAEREHLKEEKENQDKEEKGESPFFKLDPVGLMAGVRGGGGGGGGGGLFGLDSPLQRMASITNSLVSQPLPSPHFNQRPLKAILPPITQQQFDLFSHLNTDDVVRRIKEILSQYSISQRLFGEAVLGLSQGSVSDLLARPKPWHMLTQKGREPFIRMKIFLDDDSAIHKLVASQYKILPDKLLRTGAYSGPPVLQSPKLTTSHPQFHSVPSLISSGRLPHQMLPGMERSMLAGLQQRHLVTSLPHLTPNLYEMAALTQELDTMVVTNKVKELLLAHNTGQKLFGEAVLGLSQGSVSELLSKPKPWHMLSIKGREPFIRMQMWLNDPTSMDKLTAIKRLQEESRRRKRTYDESYSGRSSPSDVSDIYSNPGYANSPDDGSAKRMARDGGNGEGLDLSFKHHESNISSGMLHRDDIVEEDEEEEEPIMVARQPEDDPDEETPAVSSADDLSARGAPASRREDGGRRRKPLAPQWVNPDWTEPAESTETATGRRWEEEKDMHTINGVCVMMNPAVFAGGPPTNAAATATAEAARGWATRNMED